MRASYLILTLLLFSTISQAQVRHQKGPNQVTYPEVSKQASVSQIIGITTIQLDYHRPRILGRNLWGALIPYGKVWRAGANESTKITFTDDVSVEGKSLKAGIYSIHMIPKESEWTIIFSNNYSQWGSFYYDKSEDALRLKITPEQIPHQELLTYQFEGPCDTLTTLTMSWGTIKVGMDITVNQNEIVIAEFRRNLQTLPRFRWFGNREAALYCVLNETNYDEAIGWIDRSLRFEENFSNLIVKADLLRLQGKSGEADEWEAKAQAKADTINWVGYGYETLGHHGRLDKSISHFLRGITYYPESYILHRSLADAYGLKGDIEKAKESFMLAEKYAKTANDREQLNGYRKRYFLAE